MAVHGLPYAEKTRGKAHLVTPLRIAATGYVSEQAGSVASASSLLLRALLERGHHITFFSKASFVDPRPAAKGHPNFEFVDVDNRFADRLQKKLIRVPIVRWFARTFDTETYHHLLLKRMREANDRQRFDLCLWFGEYARGRLPGVPTVSNAQGAPGTDARSIARRYDEVVRLTGSYLALKWRVLAAIRLSPLGLPPFHYSDHIITASSVSQDGVHRLFGIPLERTDAVPYPIDLELFRLPETPSPHEGIKCLWLGRIVPRKRLDLFLDGAAEAIRRGVDLRLTVVGDGGFVIGYDKLIREFPFPDRLIWKKFAPRNDIPALMHAHDILCQPSEEEDFGSSVAEAQACGLPVIVGATNGCRDYLSPRDIHLSDYRPETLADAYAEMAARKAENRWGDPRESRRCAEENFRLVRVVDRFEKILLTTAGKKE